MTQVRTRVHSVPSSASQFSFPLLIDLLLSPANNKAPTSLFFGKLFPIPWLLVTWKAFGSEEQGAHADAARISCTTYTLSPHSISNEFFTNNNKDIDRQTDRPTDRQEAMP